MLWPNQTPARLLDQLGFVQYFSTLDLATGYWQICMHPALHEKIAFVTHEVLHEFHVMPFGLTNALAAIQQLMQQGLMDYLGYLVTPEGLKTSQRHVQAVPTTKRCGGSPDIIGPCLIFQEIYSSFTKIAQPLHVLTQKSVQFKWTEKCQQSFNHLKGRLSTAPVLVYPNFQQRFIVKTDASIQGLGSVL